MRFSLNILRLFASVTIIPFILICGLPFSHQTAQSDDSSDLLSFQGSLPEKNDSKLDARLADLAAQAPPPPPASFAPHEQSPPLPVSDLVHVIIETIPGTEADFETAAVGFGTISGRYNDLVSMEVLPANLGSLADLPQVRLVREPRRPSRSTSTC